MKYVLVLASSYGQYINFIHNFKLNKNEVRYVTEFNQIIGHGWGTSLIILEDYQYNRNYTVGFMKWINAWVRGERLIPAFLSEREIYFEKV